MLKELILLPNLFSLSRIGFALIFWIILSPPDFRDNYILITVVAILAALTDFLDGYFARKLHQVSELGKILDPLGDKVCIAIIALQFYLHGALHPALFYIIIGRDVLLIVGGLLMSSKIRQIPPSDIVGKVAVNVIALHLFLIVFFTNDSIVYQFSMFGAFIAVIVSFLNYTYRSLRQIRK